MQVSNRTLLHKSRLMLNIINVLSLYNSIFQRIGDGPVKSQAGNLR